MKRRKKNKELKHESKKVRLKKEKMIKGESRK